MSTLQDNKEKNRDGKTTKTQLNHQANSKRKKIENDKVESPKSKSVTENSENVCVCMNGAQKICKKFKPLKEPVKRKRKKTEFNLNIKPTLKKKSRKETKPCKEYVFYKDPVLEQRKKDMADLKLKMPLEKQKPKQMLIDNLALKEYDENQIIPKGLRKIRPPVGTRLEIQNISDEEPTEVIEPQMKTPIGKKILQEQQEYRRNRPKLFCKKILVKLPKPSSKIEINETLEVPSAQIGESKVEPMISTPDPSSTSPNILTEDELALNKPKSGIFINVTKTINGVEDYDSFDLVFQRKPRPFISGGPKGKRGKKLRKDRRLLKGYTRLSKKSDRGKGLQTTKVARGDEMGSYLKTIQEEELMASEMGYEEGGLDSYLTKQFRRKISMISQATSIHTKDYKSKTSLEEKEIVPSRFVTYLQKFPRDSVIKRYQVPRRKIKRGTLESHSFTNVKYQPTLKEFYFGVKAGNVHQGDVSFDETTRDRQGICMPIAVYCFAVLKHPNKWIPENVDEIIEIGNNLFLDALKLAQEENAEETEVKVNNLPKYCYVDNKKIHFVVDEPEVTGLLRSTDKRIYNLTKALKIFFVRHQSGILRSNNVNLAVWKDGYYYMFDATPRTHELYVSPNGVAVLGHFYDIAGIVTVLLDRSNYGNWPFVIYPIKAFKILNRDDPDEPEIDLENVQSNYNIINECKAVVQGSFDLADLCFDFARNKQALAMSAVALVYSRITPPSAWHRSTIDKIMVIGNQLYLECRKCEEILELTLNNLPALFTIGPYIVEIYIYPNRAVDTMYKSCNCQFKDSLEEFFKMNTNAIVEIGPFTIAVWLQRNLYYCFDPYSRDNEGLQGRNGNACVSMVSHIDCLVHLVTSNFDSRDYFFKIHALKICKIHRDPVQKDYFPEHLTMNDYPLECIKKYKMTKSKKLATSKPVTVDYTALAMRRLLLDVTPSGSIFEVGSTVESLEPRQMPHVLEKYPTKSMLKAQVSIPKFTDDIVADLDSPSLSDTQIEPKLPEEPTEPEEIEFMDLDSCSPTIEELELADLAEDEGDEEGGGGDFMRRKLKIGGEDYEVEGGEDEEGEDEFYYTRSGFAQVDSKSLASADKSKISEEMNTEITYYKIKRDILYPTYIRGKQAMKQRLQPFQQQDDWGAYLADEPTITKSKELLRETNFVTLPDDTEIIRGTKNLSSLGDDIEFIAPFVCVMAAVVSKKYSVYSWNSSIVDYILTCGEKLYKSSKVRYDQVAKLEIPRVTIGKSDYKVLVEYVFDTYSRQSILELAIEKILFVRSDLGVLVTPTYACALINKNHLYYMFDGFGNNEVGLSEGPSNDGVACLARFKDVHSLASRIIYNKKKRENEAGIVYTRFVLSSVRCKEITDLIQATSKDKQKKKKKTNVEKEMEMYGNGEDAGLDEDLAGDAEEELGEDEKKPKQPVIIGFQKKDQMFVIEGSKKLNGRQQVTGELKEDHFCCICSCLILLLIPLNKWDNKKVNEAIVNGKHIFSHAQDLDISDKRSITNVLIGKHFFDIIVKKIKINNLRTNRNLFIALDTLLTRKLSAFMVQFPSACYVIHHSPDDLYHIFDPYGIVNRRKRAEENFAGWIRFPNMKALKRHIKVIINRDINNYSFYNFQVTSIKKAPKEILMNYRLEQYKLEKQKKQEPISKIFYEDIKWLEGDQMPWSQRLGAGKLERDTIGTKWHNWDIVFERDLFVLFGNINQISEKFSPESRGKQTLSNLIVALGMLEIYELSEWNAAVIDSILDNGDTYFRECIKDIKDLDYEISLDDLKPECTIFPYTFNVSYQSVIEGMLFMVRSKVNNLYKGLRYFFGNTDLPSYGIITVTKTNIIKHVAFGKIKESEYFMFDTDSFGFPMFTDRQGFPYILRITSLNRLLHVLTLTFRGGSFYIFKVEISNLKPIE